MKATDEEVIHIQKIRWAIEFCSTDLERLEKGHHLTALGGLEEYKYQLYEFVRDSNLQGSDRDPHKVDNQPGPPGEFVATMTAEHMKQTQRELHKGLSALADDKSFSLTLGQDGSLRFRKPRIGWINFNPLLPFMQTITIDTDPVSKAVLALGLHITYSGLTGERIRRCPECATIFIRERKPQKGREQYCSLTCTQAAATKKYRSKKEAAGSTQIEKPGQTTHRKAGKKRTPRR